MIIIWQVLVLHPPLFFGGTMEKECQDILDSLLENDGKQRLELEKKLQRNLDMDELNLVYFIALYSKYKMPASNERPLVIHEKNIAKSRGTIAFPTAIASNQLLIDLPVTEYSTLLEEMDSTAARNAVLWIKKMQAGTGSSMTRKSYLARIWNKKEDEVKIGAKGTDLCVNIATKNVSIAELQILQAINDITQGLYSGIELHDIVSNETGEAIEAIWHKPSLIEPSKSYKALIDETNGLNVFGKSFQSQIPTINREDKISFNRKAPGGHALFGVDGLRAAYKDELRPQTNGKPLICSIGNGEDLSSAPDSLIVSWMIKEKIPLAMVTTTKTGIDIKGGQIALVPVIDGISQVTMIEKAQAEASNQLELFCQLGLRDGDGKAYFNTNMVLINYEELTPRIKGLVDEIGEDEFMKVIAPDLIKNSKKQVDRDGVERSYLQLEGAMGSSMLNLDRYWRSRYNTPLVHFLNIDSNRRTNFFSPVKTAFDYFMQFHSDRFKLDLHSFRLINQNPGSILSVMLTDSYYVDVENVLTAFDNTEILKLRELNVKGKVNFSGLQLIGSINVENQSKTVVRLRDLLLSNELIDRSIVINVDGKLE